MHQRYTCLLFVALSGYCFVHAQNVGLGTATPHASAVLDITSTNKGLLIPRMTTANIAAVSNPAKGLLVYDSIKNELVANMGTPVSPNWQSIAGSGGWGLSGNSGTNAGNHFIGTTDNVALVFRVNNLQAGKIEVGNSGSTSLGWESAKAITTATYNTAIGTQALTSNAAANFNTAIGAQALRANTSGTLNVATGSWAMYSNTAGSNNTAMGHSALYQSSSNNNVGMGYYALGGTNTGGQNVAVGSSAMSSVGQGNHNVAIGYQALYRINGGSFNTATGAFAMNFTNNGSNNTAMGNQVMWSNTTGGTNSAFGNAAMYSNTTGSNNVGVGYNALYFNATGSYNTAVGTSAGNNNGTIPINFTALGYNAGHVGSGSNTIEIGNTSVTWIGGNVGWSTFFSDGRAKTDLKEDIPGISFIKKLRPVTYRLNLRNQQMLLGNSDTIEWAGKYDIEQQIQSGFVAQEVEQAAKELHYNFNGVTPPQGNRKLYSMQYAAFVVPLVKAVQEQQQIIEAQQKKIDWLTAQVEVLMKKQ